jgi:hypothetical protein
VLAGNKDIPYGTLSGFRVTGGFYADCDRRYGFEATGWVIAEKSVTTDIQSSPTGIPTLARPFIDSTNVRAATSQVIANPNFGSGRVVVDNTTQVYSVEANGLVNLYRSGPDCGKKCAWSLDFLAGYRYLELQEALSVESNTTLNLPATTTPVFAIGPFGILTQVGTTVTPGSLPVAGITARPPALITVRDDFRVTNRFNGGQVGLRAEARHGMFTFAATGKLALGNMHQRLEINGTTGVIDPSRNQIGGALGGLLANASNIGRYNHDEFAVIPEVNLNLGLNVTRGLTTFIGYNFLYIDNVARPASQINPIVNTATVPLSPNYGATNRPAVVNQLFNQDEYWLMGVNFGFMLRY